MKHDRMPQYVRSSTLRGISVRAGTLDLTLSSIFLDHDDWAVRFFRLHPLVAVSGEHQRSADDLVGSPLQIAGMDTDAGRIILSENRSKLASLHGDSRNGRVPAAATAELTRQCRLSPFWNGTSTWGDCDTPQAVDLRAGHGLHDDDGTGEPPALIEDHMLMSLEVTSADGPLGDIADLAVDIVHWRVRYMVVRLTGDDDEEERLLSPFWTSIRSGSSHISVPMTKATVLNAPCFDPEDLTAFDERVLAKYYGFLVES